MLPNESSAAVVDFVCRWFFTTDNLQKSILTILDYSKI